MNHADLEKKATQKARTVDPQTLPFPTTTSDWQTWVSEQGQWIFIEKAVVDTVATAFSYEKEQAFQWVGTKMLDWLIANSAQVKPRAIWKIRFEGCKDKPVNFGVFQNQCFVFMPRKIDV